MRSLYQRQRRIVRIILLVFLVVPLLLQAQRPTKRSRSELGLMYGVGYYIGDLNQTGHFKNAQPAFGLLYRFNVHSRLALRANLTYGSFEADDADSKFELLRNRNLHFRTDILEAAGGLEFNYWPFEIGHPRYKATAYFLVELGVYHFNPQAEYEGEWVDLQPLGTEGQGSQLTRRKKYATTQVSMPLGLGFRMTLGKIATINLEYGIRKTFTDYLDDVGSETYLPYSEIAEANGIVAANLSNRSLDNSRNGRRGNSTTSDWYAFTGIMVTFRLGPPKKCFFEPY